MSAYSVVFLMATEPGTGVSVAALAVAAIAGWAGAPSARSQERSQARVAGSER